MIRDNDQYLTDYFSETGDGQVTTNDWYARTAGTYGNSIGVEVCPSAQAYEQDLGSNNLVNGAGAVGDKTITVDDADEAGFAFQVGDMIKFHEAFMSQKSLLVLLLLPLTLQLMVVLVRLQ